MKVKASELQQRQRIHIEYGDFGNWVDLTIDEIHCFQHMTVVMFHLGSIRADVSFQPDEQVEVLQEDA